MESPDTTNYIAPDEVYKAMHVKRLAAVDASIVNTQASIERLSAGLGALERERDFLQGLLRIWEPEKWEKQGQMLVNRENGAMITELSHNQGAPIAPVYQEHAADLVVRLLKDSQRPLHYREIERELRERGWYTAGGVDPANTLLAKYFKDDRLYRPSKGVYALRPDGAPVRNAGARSKKTAKRTGGRRRK